MLNDKPFIRKGGGQYWHLHADNSSVFVRHGEFEIYQTTSRNEVRHYDLNSQLKFLCRFLAKMVTQSSLRLPPSFPICRGLQTLAMPENNQIYFTVIIMINQSLCKESICTADTSYYCNCQTILRMSIYTAKRPEIPLGLR